ncbi:MAG TPA: GNAT family N-acetyltransferase [Steroidobacteraceae bacterium]|nr:GNAT family N-acetyltransferase [Steroidobacteraceae bacterium]
MSAEVMKQIELEATTEQATKLAEFGARTFYESFAADNTEEDMRRHLESAWSPDKQLAELRNPDIDTLILTDDGGRWLGFAQLRANKISDGVPAQGSVELWRFYVDKPFHGKGVASGLMNRAKQRATHRGATSMWLGVWERNERAKAFYAKHGFRKVGAQVFVVGSDPQTDDVMLCPLS